LIDELSELYSAETNFRGIAEERSSALSNPEMNSELVAVNRL